MAAVLNGLTKVGATLPTIILMAYGLRDFQLVGGPNWIYSNYFEIIATKPKRRPRSKLDSGANSTDVAGAAGGAIQAREKARPRVFGDWLRCGIETVQRKEGVTPGTVSKNVEGTGVG